MNLWRDPVSSVVRDTILDFTGACEVDAMHGYTRLAQSAAQSAELHSAAKCLGLVPTHPHTDILGREAMRRSNRNVGAKDTC